MHVTDSLADPGVLIGQGRAASVYALDDRCVLRRYAKPRSCAGQAELMRYLRQAGYPVPEVLAVDGRDLVLERLNGPDMLADLIRRPWRVLHLDLHPANVMLTRSEERRVGKECRSGGSPGHVKRAA